MIVMRYHKTISGMTLVELLLAMSILTIVAGVSARVITVAMASWSYNRTQNETIQSACFALDHIVNKAGVSNRLLLPLDPNSTRDVLAFSATRDTDGDGLIDEDPGADLTGDGAPGILGIDDDGDGQVDEEGQAEDDDEDSYYSLGQMNVNEDKVDSQDNDADGSFDEDPDNDLNQNNLPGIAGKDDDGDGTVDDGWAGLMQDDDEDGQVNEDPIEYWVYYCDPACDPNGGQLIQRDPNGHTAVLAEGVTTFEVTRREANSSGVELTLGITASGGEETLLKTAVYLLPAFEFADYVGWP